MFVGRERELSTMEALCASDSFEMLVIYGRRRVGKTALIEEFSRGKRTLSFTAQLQSDKDNLADFSRAVAEFYGLPESMPAFASWLDALAFIAQGGERRAHCAGARRVSLCVPLQRRAPLNLPVGD